MFILHEQYKFSQILCTFPNVDYMQTVHRTMQTMVMLMNVNRSLCWKCHHDTFAPVQWGAILEKLS